MSTASLRSPISAPSIPGAPLRLAILASGAGTNLQAIAQAIDRGELNAHIDLVLYNRKTAAVAEKAAMRNIPSHFVDHRSFESREACDAALVEHLKAANIQWVILAGWMRLITEPLLDAFPNRILNIHPSLLPSFPGLRAVEQSLQAGVKITGCTVHIVTAEMDAGPIIAQAAVPVCDDDTVETLHERIQIEEHRLYPMSIALAAMADGSSEQSMAVN